MKKNLDKMAMLFVTVLVLNMITAFSVLSLPPTRIHLAPSNYRYDTDTVTAPCYKFNVTVMVSDVTDLAVYQITIIFNDSIINATRWYEPTGNSTYVFYQRTTLPVPTPPNPGYVHNDPNIGSVTLGSGLFPPPPTQGSFTGSGLLCIVEFHITKIPSEGETLSCDLNINTADTFLLDPVGDEIPDVVKENGYYELRSTAAPPQHTLTINSAPQGVSFTIDSSAYTTPKTLVLDEGTYTITMPSTHETLVFINWTDGVTNRIRAVSLTANTTLTAVYGPPAGTRLYVDPPEIIDPNAVPSTTFDINITIDDVVNLHTCEFNLTYNTDVLGWIGIKLHKVVGQTPRANAISDDEVGYIWAKLTYQEPVTSASPLALVTITFHVENFGTSPLDLHDTHLIDINGDPIDHQTFDGLFMSLIRDVAIINVSLSANSVFEGQLVYINVTAKNLGNINETFDVKAYYDTTNLIGTGHVIDLPPDDEVTLTFTWNTSGVPACHYYTISGEATTVPYESNTANNVYIDGTVKIRFLGDINEDDKVDMSDIYIVIQAFGSYPGHPRWNPVADIDQNGAIDMRDIYIVLKNFGKGCT